MRNVVVVIEKKKKIKVCMSYVKSFYGCINK